MQTIINFLANNYLWFIIIALILVFALIGYLVDTSERDTKISNLEKQIQDEENETTEILENSNALNMDMGQEELNKDVIVMPNQLENLVQEEDITKETEVLDVE